MGENERRANDPSGSVPILTYVDVMVLRGVLESVILEQERFMAQYGDSMPNMSFHSETLETKKELLKKLSSAPEFHGRTFSQVR